ncbi:MAG: transposase, partial [Candidatus Lokiarchaeota archaeon]|nr:transposase [Candidatus Lokiarchaeota archaeon]
KTEKEYKEKFEFLKEVDAKALQSEWRHLKSAYDNFFRNLKKGFKGDFPRFKSKKSRQSYTTYNINNNCKIYFKSKKLKLPKTKAWINFEDDREFDEEIKHITVSKTRSGKYYASILVEIVSNIEPMKKINENKIVAFDISATDFLITKRFKLTNPRFYRTEHHRLRKYHKEVSRRKKGSKNRERTRVKLARIYEKINNRKKDWINKITHLLSDKKIYFSHGSYILGVLIVQGSSEEFQYRLNLFSLIFEKKYENVLKNYTGKISEFKSSRDLIPDVFTK